MTSSRVITVVPTMDTNIYANGDVWFETTEVPLGVSFANCTPWLVDVQVVDGDDQTLFIWDLYLLRSNVAIGTLNGAANISDANALEIIGRIPFDGTATIPDGIDIGTSKLYSMSAGKPPLPIMCKPAAGNPTKLYIAGVVRTGTPTNTAAGVTLKLGFVEKT